MVPGKWKRGHWARGENSHLQPLPGPNDDVPDDDEDLPEELQAEIDQLDWLDAQREPEADSGPPPEDPPPARLRGPRQGPAPKRGRAPTATLRKDVHAKIRMILVPVSRGLAYRDGICGPVLVEQEPDISSALADIVCDSPDLLNWFTGPAGGYMKYFNLFMACLPVGMVAWSHHIVHAEQEAPPNPVQPAFAA